MSSSYAYPSELISDVFSFVHEIGTRSSTEFVAIICRDEIADKHPIVRLNGAAFTDSEDEARARLSILETFPGRDRALEATVCQQADPRALSRRDDAMFIDESKRYLADGMWTHASLDDLWPNLRSMLENWPAAPTHLCLWPWRHDAQRERPSMAISVEQRGQMQPTMNITDVG